MRKLGTIGALIALATVGCGSEARPPCEGSVLLGTYTGMLAGNPDTLVFNADCSGTASFCQATFTHQKLTASSGTMSVTVNTGRTDPLCLSVGAHSCTYSHSGTALTFACDGSADLTYTKQ